MVRERGEREGGTERERSAKEVRNQCHNTFGRSTRGTSG